jgi:hypothetical protein
MVVRAVETGVAIEDGETFRSHPDASEGPVGEGHLDPANVIATADAIRHVVAAHRIERLIVTAGEADHECDGRRWSDRHERIHLALVRDRIRVLIDLASFALDDVQRIAAALDRLDDREREPPPHLRLAPNVTAALLPVLAAAALPNVTVRQRPGGVDGKGFPIIDIAGEWQNWYRPSYRFRPIRMPLHLEARCDVTGVNQSLPVAVALLAPVRDLTLRVLIDDGQRVRPATVPVTHIQAIGPTVDFYPYGAGSFGAEMML